MKNSFCLLIWLFLLCKSPVFSQDKFAWELYAGPSQSFLTHKIIPNNDLVKPSNELRYHFGTTFLWGLKNDWQISAQAEFFKRELGTYAVSSSIDSIQITGYSTEGIPLLAIGARKSWGNIYIQPSLSVMKSPRTINIYESTEAWKGITLGVRSHSNLGLGLRFESGLKIYNRRGNYFFGGLRYQQGLILMDEMNAPVRYSEKIEHVLSAKSRGSYIGLFLGYGILGQNIRNSSNWSSRQYFSEQKLLKHNLAMEDGLYFMLYGGLRRRENPLSYDFIYSNTSGNFQAVVGYNYGRFSIESGYGNFSYNANYQIDFDGVNALIMNWEKYDMSVVPITLKYHIPINDSQTIRFGPSFSTFFALKNQSNSWFTSSFSGSNGTVNHRYYYAGNAYSDRELTHSRFVFNAGLFVEASVFNSSFLTFKISRNFGSPDFVKIKADYLIDGTQVHIESVGNINGFMMELGYKLPLKVFDYQWKKFAQNLTTKSKSRYN
ncbi:hypothetical protein SYJ56_14070 [Algoriphagus sp. D3-2-R+10]|uniref:hypothetical protein n=1 Tax=Algoriphagus aurantiacus TaxID=3103948 RepID=UPI002B391D41|nr:hypothetical protein [Algoriphagus sp. D3-2-R+10]MEB2776445.1 hypothetical protein [Algoriphagus sp. D3-2-R+10]